MEIDTQKLIKLCKEFGVEAVARDLRVSSRLIYYRLQGVDLGGRKRSGRKKKIILT